MYIYDRSETTFNHNGYGILSDALSAKVTEVLNGDMYLELSYPANGRLSEYLVEENIIKCNVGNNNYQLFRIKRKTNTFLTIEIYAMHIFYDLLNNFIVNAAPYNLDCQTYGQWILSKAELATDFTFTSDIAGTASARYVRKNPVECIIGESANSMVNKFGGELERDNYNIKFNARRGADNGVKLLAGKNITSVKVTIDITSMATRVLPLGFDGLMIPEVFVDSSHILDYPTPKIMKVEFSDIKYDPEDSEAYQTEEEAYQALRDATNKLYADGLDLPAITIKVDWLELSKMKGYEAYTNIERVNIGDTVTAYVLGMNYQTRVVKTIYNVLLDRIEKFEIGTQIKNITTSINNAVKASENISVANTNSLLDSARSEASELISTAMGGYVVKTDTELLIMDTDDVNTAQKVWRWNINGLGYSNTGVNGTYSVAMTMDGKIVADMITTGTMSVDRIHGLDQLIIQVQSNTDDVNTINTYFSYEPDGLRIGKAGSEYENTIDNMGNRVTYNGNNVLKADATGVSANAFIVDDLWHLDTLTADGNVLGIYKRS